MKQTVIIMICLTLFTWPVSAEMQLGDRTLSYGAWGADVFYLQRHLVRAGYDLVVDGHFGTQTRRAVTAFQLARSLTPDGIVGQDTIRALTAQPTSFIYTVRSGDSIWKIARDFSVSMDQIMSANGLSDGPIYIGQKLEIPAAFQPVGSMPSPQRLSSYMVQPGDNLSKIAATFGTTVDELATRNHIVNPSLILPGQVLMIP